jgi:putative hemolysin
MDVIPQLLLVLILVFLNGFFVASEFALVAVRKTRIDVLVRKGHRSARLVQKSINDLDTFISATQLGITLASLGLGWVGEPVLAKLLEPILLGFLPTNLVFATSHGIAVSVAFTIITFLHIVLGELAPKTLALQRSEQVSLAIIAPLLIFATIFKPFIWILNEAGALVLRLIGFKAPSGHQLVHSEEEIKMILAQSAESGAIEKEEAEMVYSVLKLGDVPARDIMVPKGKIVAFELESSLRRVLSVIQKNPHSRFPVYKENIDNIVGFVHVKDIYRAIVEDGSFVSVRDLYKSIILKRERKLLSQLKLRKIPRVKLTTRVDDVLIELRMRRVHIAVVEEEDATTAGIVTLEDAVESLVGEIHDEFEELEKEKETLIRRFVKKF